MTTWVLNVSEDGCETMLTGVDNLDCNPQLLTCTEGKPMIQIKEFNADSYDEAKVVMDKWLSEERWDWERANSPHAK